MSSDKRPIASCAVKKPIHVLHYNILGMVKGMVLKLPIPIVRYSSSCAQILDLSIDQGQL